MINPYKTAKIDFEIIRDIGQNGRNSTTHLVRDPQLNAEIVAKTIAKHTVKSPNDFFRESQVLYASAHPHVVQIHYACYDDDNIYIAMPYYKNGSLKELIDGNKTISIRKALAFSTQILSALQNIHSKGLIHFDIKPDNILLSNRNEALVSDFGLTKHQDIYATATPEKIYNKMMPPEACTRKGDFDISFDIYQFGLTLYRICNGNQHFQTQLKQYSNFANFVTDVTNGKFPNRKSYLAHIPIALRKIINKCLETDPTKRYKSAIEVVNAIAPIDGNHLDWVLTTNNNERIWTKEKDGVQYTLLVDSSNKAIGTRTSAGGAPRKLTEMCGSNSSDKDIYSMLGSR